LQCD
jgi:hypothetical protein